VGNESAAREVRFTAPPELLETSDFVMAEIRGSHKLHAGWSTPMKVYFRKTSEGWQTVGIERF